MPGIHPDITSAFGDTPLVRLNRVAEGVGGNILAKLLSHLAKSDSAGLVLGARVPIILTSRSDSVRARIASCAIGMLAAYAQRPAVALPSAKAK